MSRRNPYVRTVWKDHIVDESQFEIVTDGNGNPVLDENGKEIPLIDPKTKEPKPKVIQEGTRHSAARHNNVEEGLYKAFDRIIQLEDQGERDKIADELNDRVPNNTGIFYDVLDETEPKKIIRQTATATLTAPRAAGTTVLNVDSTVGFQAFTVVTIYNGTNKEQTTITAVTESTITVQALANSYVKGAKVARSNSKIEGNKMKSGTWGTYKVTMTGVV